MSNSVQVQRKTIRYLAQDDIYLLRLVLEINPFTDSAKSNKLWEKIAERLSDITKKELSSRSVKERTNLLLNQYNKNCLEHLRKSTTDEQYSEKIRLLPQVAKLLASFRSRADNGNTSVQYIDMGRNIKCDTTLYDSFDEDIDCMIVDDNDDDNPPQLPKTPLKDFTIKMEPSTSITSVTTGVPTTVNTNNNLFEISNALGQDRKITPIKISTNVKKRAVKHPSGVPVKNKIDMKSQIELRKIAVEEKKAELELRKHKLEEARFKSEREDKEKRREAELKEREMKTKAEIEDTERRREVELREKEMRLTAELELKKKKMLICDRIMEFIENINL